MEFSDDEYDGILNYINDKGIYQANSIEVEEKDDYAFENFKFCGNLNEINEDAQNSQRSTNENRSSSIKKKENSDEFGNQTLISPTIYYNHSYNLNFIYSATISQELRPKEHYDEIDEIQNGNPQNDSITHISQVPEENIPESYIPVESVNEEIQNSTLLELNNPDLTKVKRIPVATFRLDRQMNSITRSLSAVLRN